MAQSIVVDLSKWQLVLEDRKWRLSSPWITVLLTVCEFQFATFFFGRRPKGGGGMAQVAQW